MQNQGRWRFDEALRNLKSVEMRVPGLLARQAQDYFTNSFRKSRLGEEYKWPEVQRRIAGTKAYKYPPKGSRLTAWRHNPILVGNAVLMKKVASSIREVSWRRIRLVVDGLEYAEIHNEGGYAGRGHKARIPKRSYMKQTRELTNKQIDLIKRETIKIWD